ncbi:MAG: alpha/beta fold hydrolase, partial [Pseudomonadales bacterium]
MLVGSGLGGTSLINANVAETPQPQVFQKPEWPHEFRNDPAPLIDEFQRVREILSVSTHPQKDLPKYQALVRLTGALDAMNGVDASVRKAQVTVMFDDKANNVGVRQRACTDCGNCVTGCNVGAKGTLDRNILPLAKSRGARIYTGVTVLTLRERPGEAYRWLLCVTPTTPLKGTVRKNTYWMLAKSVILAAGTLGSTEILLRSQELEKLPLSNRLGERFSTNGDGLIMSYGQSSPVNAIASAEQQAPDVPNKVGPTITGIVDVSVSQSAGCGAHLTLEEAAIPAAVSRLFIEALTTSAQLQRLSNRKLPKFIKANKIDPLVGSRLAAQHSQVLLVMGDDGAAGNLGLSKVSDGEALESVIQIDFPDAQKNAALAQSNRLIKSQDRSDGLDGGQYAPNPLWEVLPEAASSVLSGDLPKGRAMTVHPLGGCAMGDDVNSGVVNHEGQVFRPGAASATATYEGLYVLDGAIIPAALEVNPFLTIAALAWRNVGRILVSRDEDESTTNQVVEAYRDVGDPPYSAIDEHAVDFTLQEQLVGQLSSVTPWFEARLRQGIVAAGVTEPEKVEDYLESDLKRLAQVDGLVMEVEAHLVDTGQWLESPGPVAATATLYVNMLGADDVRRMRPYGVSRTHIDHMVPFAKLEGRFTLLKEDHHNWFSDFFGAIGAILAYRKRRTTTKGFWRRPLREWMVFFNIGALQSRLRRMQYEFESDEVRISGEKVLGYNRSLERLWPALLYLPLEFRDKKHRKTTSASMAVALEDLVDSGFLQLASPANLPRAALTAAGVGGYFVRSIFSTSFWEFGGMDYPQTRVAQKTLPRAIKRDNGTLVEPEFKTINVQLRAGSEAHFPLLMSRYPNPAATRGPILLLHGLAQGSQIFWTESLDTNLAVFMYEAGYDVWMADYRLSNHVLPNIHDRDWSMDEIAAFDIPAIIHHVHDQTGRPVTIFAHCVGACTIAMSVLSGKTPSDRIKAVAANAIHPYVITSPANRVRAKLGSFYRDWITTDYLNPIPGPGEGAWQNFMDRLAFSAAKVRELALDDHRSYCDDGLAEGICDRMSLLYGRMWNHKNLDPRTHQAFVHLFGPAPGSVYRHIYYYSLLQRIAASNGENEYLQLEKIRDNWNFPTLFLHGEDSRVFNPYSAERSAIRLREIKPDLAVAFKRVADYGHMDIVFGKNAHKDVYGDVISFFDQPVSSVAPLKAGEVFIYRPNIGPILRAAWVRDGKLYLRFWAELKRGLTDSAVALAVKGDQVKAVSEVGV